MARFVLHATHPDTVTARWPKTVTFDQSDVYVGEFTDVVTLAMISTKVAPVKAATVGEFANWLRDNAPSARIVLRHPKELHWCFEVAITSRKQAFHYRLRWT
ncbi:hypothetical protein SAMN02799636_04322 [Methylobacterium sp. 275MFSha3.1]|uniref:hypothetical protein n=1 Tax=Methylobacterium sp. 275MFSha3.1 TaxID=1502746 RepID=UPI0008A7B819|nr:hypothetical protein [Methylobacterium sp. 275MFSha3.1]SEH89306.1 hypothetical protein SAMN02799636_04322 [Methylobacterium sp. 275MFSha3.1]